MGYTTSFDGAFDIVPKLTKKDNDFLRKFSDSRRVGWKDKGNEFGTDGEWFVGAGASPNYNDKGIIHYNEPPATQPGLWCNWAPGASGEILQWNGAEKFYEYVLWLKYLIDNYLAPRGYVLNGVCFWAGEEDVDKGKIVVKNNKVLVAIAEPVTYGLPEEV
jgi:hypothetical protein